MTDASETGERQGDLAIEIGDLPRGRLPEALSVLARGMRDNPLHVAAYGPDPELRVSRHRRLMAAVFRMNPAQQPIVALHEGQIVAVAGSAPPGTCQLSPLRVAREFPGLIRLGPVALGRMLRWGATWARQDPEFEHVHLGPVAVDLHLQRRGIGSRLLAEHCRRLDTAGQTGYLETDKPENVTLYRRFGYEVIAQAPTLGSVPTWFMVRFPVHSVQG